MRTRLPSVKWADVRDLTQQAVGSVSSLLGLADAAAGDVFESDGNGGATPVTPATTPTLGMRYHVSAATHNPAGGATAYFGSSGAAPSVSAGHARVYVLDAGTITGASVYSYASSVAGTGEDWVLAIRLNDTTDTTIATVASTAAGRVFTNLALSIAVVAGDFFELKATHPSWATAPEGVTYGGGVYIE